MAEKYNATCSICGSPYYKCISCRDTMSLSPWKAFCCSSQHYQVHQVIRGFNSGVYTKDEAKNKLKNINLNDIESFRPHIKQIVKDILKEEKITVEFDVVENVVKIENDVVVENIEKVEEPEDVIKTTYSRKRNFKVDNEIEEIE